MTNKGTISATTEDGLSVFTLDRDMARRGHTGSKNKKALARGLLRAEMARANTDRNAHTAKTKSRNQSFVHNFTKLLSFQVPEP